MAEHRRAVIFDVVIEPNTVTSIGQKIGKRRLADLERIAAEIVAVQLDQIEGIEEHPGVVPVVTDAVEARHSALVAGDGLPIDDASNGPRSPGPVPKASRAI